MKHDHTVQAASETFADHLQTIMLQNPSLKEDFRKRMGGVALSQTQLSLMEIFASVNLAESLHTHQQINWWHVFTDPFKQTLLPMKMPVPDLQQDSISAVIIFTGWNIQNYKLIMDIDTSDITPPSYPADIKDIQDTPTLLSYLEKQMLPILKNHLRWVSELTLQELEGRLAEKASLYELEHVPGVETLSPILPSQWNGHPAP